MKGLDTNVLVRLLVADDAAQAEQALRYVARNCTADAPCWLNRIVLCELVWVLDRAYGYGREEIGKAVESLLRTAQLVAEDAEPAWAALRIYRAGGDFADALIGRSNQLHGCDATGTFDRQAARLDGFEIV